MSSDLLPSSIAGFLFGSALTLSGVYLPSVILSQLQLKDFHMLKVFLSASSASALAIALYERLARRELCRRPSSNLGLSCPYDGNIIGGAMVGVGMALTGACPGTVLVQVGTGVESGRYAIVGGVMGGILYTFLARSLRRAAPSCADVGGGTFSEKLGMNSNVMVLIFEAMCISMILAARHFVPGPVKSFLDPVTGGLLLGTTQLVTLVLTKNPIGVSTAYEDVGRWFWDFLGYRTTSSKSGTKTLLSMSRAIAFAGGILVSSFAISTAVPEAVVKDSLAISPSRGILGGLIMVLGARIAGGCPSGHGISGMSMLGVSSFITVASMFAGGIGLALAM